MKKGVAGGAAATNAPMSAPPIVRDVLGSAGRPLDRSTRSFMESRFGHDFGSVRVHADSRAAESARVVSAAAYTVGHSVVFGAGRYAPGTREGRRLLAHELTHVVQSGGGAAPGGPIAVGSVHDPQEAEADRMADMVSRHAPGAAPLRSRTDGTVLRRAPGDEPQPMQKQGPARPGGGTTPPVQAPPDAGTTPASGCTAPTAVTLASSHTVAFPGYMTGGGICAVMDVAPAVSGLCQVQEQVTRDPGSTCPVSIFAGGGCGGSSLFTPGRNQVRSCASVPMPPSGFVDRHTANIQGTSVLHDATRNPAGLNSCSFTCNQTYFPAGGTNPIGRFNIRYDLSKGPASGPNVTLVTATKTPAP